MKYIVEQGPWIVRGLEHQRISAISSRLGRPVMMEQVTLKMCKGGSMRLRYAKVLVEVDAKKNFLEKIEINYADAQKNVKIPIKNVEAEKHVVRNVINIGGNKDGFVEVRKMKKYWNNKGMNNTLQVDKKVKFFYSFIYALNSSIERRELWSTLMNHKSIAAEEELKLLHKKAKFYWLKEGDKNSAYFHSILRARKNRSRVETICKQDGSRADGNEVPDQFVNNFKILG
uniref:RNA-directed DNA polymerase, eukaryota, reverse transcriptase zinc-binding domain protein n=1 Tax=Tanacetum cinerariifolium TaxID=118510 RepID=A0A699JS09_TANCI|nr:RNA-directed DNA polymerase, eukaryota, reverse transcriptase zinc-binding domain protein [Tanacetum cinerariifolium]